MTVITAPDVKTIGDHTITTGAKFNRDLRPVERNKKIRVEVREYLKSSSCPVPGVKVSVAKGSGYSDLSITIVADFSDDEISEVVSRDGYGEQRVLKGVYRELAEHLKAIAAQYFKIDHSSMTDYHHGGFLFVYMNRIACNGGVLVA